MHQVPARVRRRRLNKIKEAVAAASFLMKSFDQTFSKVCAGRGRAALVARRNERNSLYGISLVLSLCLLAQRKHGENYLNVMPQPCP
jgi:hypothetical protein